MREPGRQKSNGTHHLGDAGSLDAFAPSSAEPLKVIDTDPGAQSDPLAEFALDTEPADDFHEIRSLRIETRRPRPYLEVTAAAAIGLIGVLVLKTVSMPAPRVAEPESRSASSLIGQQTPAPPQPGAEASVPVDAPPPAVEVEEQPSVPAAIAVAERSQLPRPTSRPFDREASSTSARPTPTTGATRAEAPRAAPAPATAAIVNAPGRVAAATPSVPPPPLTTTSLPAPPPEAPPLAAATSAVSAVAPAPSPLPAPSPAPPAAAASRADTQRSAVQSTLGRYASAFSTLDASRAKAVWPTVNQRNLERAFDSLEQQEFDLGECDIMVLPPRALASCDGTTRYTPKVGNRKARTESRRWTFQLRQNADEWTIENVQSQ